LITRFPAQLGLAIASAVLLAAAHEPLGLFFLAPIALVPWLIACRWMSATRAAGVGFLGGLVYFSTTLHWIWHATFVGSLALMVWISLYWLVAGAVFSVLLQTLDRRTASVLPALIGIPAAWTALEWLRSWLLGGFPYAMISHTQIKLTTMCQVADFGGEFAVTFWVVLVNAAVVGALLHRPLIVTLGLATPALCFAAIYGIVRVNQWPRDAAGERERVRVLVVQSDFRHERGGAKTVTLQDQMDFHFAITGRALASQPVDQPVDLVVWSETVLPPMNDEALRSSRNPELSTVPLQRLRELTSRYDTSIVFGAYALLGRSRDEDADVRTSTYLYTPQGLSPRRYDKIHLVPFGEHVPFKRSIPWLHRLLFRIAAYSVQYVITPGDRENLLSFELTRRDGSGQAWRFVTPICFEDSDPVLVREMLRPQPGGGKRADVLVNITNDGWFSASMKRQHIAAAAFRSIEHRIWSVRSANTGISGFIDAAGRFSDESTIAPNTAGVKVMSVPILRTTTPYARVGNLLAWMCAVVSVLAIAAAVSMRRRA
jgi:apolipoprotein N-acyltransferase